MGREIVLSYRCSALGCICGCIPAALGLRKAKVRPPFGPRQAVLLWSSSCNFCRYWTGRKGKESSEMTWVMYGWDCGSPYTCTVACWVRPTPCCGTMKSRRQGHLNCYNFHTKSRTIEMSRFYLVNETRSLTWINLWLFNRVDDSEILIFWLPYLKFKKQR